MGSQITIRISESQASALECCDGGGLDAADFPAIVAARRADRLVFGWSERDALWSELNEISNCEDAQADELRRVGHGRAATLAGRAARSLACLAGKVLRSVS